MAEQRDSIDHHVERWQQYWKDSPWYNAGVEGAMTRMQSIVRAQRRLNAEAFDGHDLSWEDYETLHVLMVQPYPVETTPAQLAEALHITRAAMTSRLDRLVERGFVTRETDPLDRRRVVVRPTTSGSKTWDAAVHEGMVREQKLLGPLSEREIAQLNRLLRKVTLALEG